MAENHSGDMDIFALCATEVTKGVRISVTKGNFPIIHSKLQTLLFVDRFGYKVYGIERSRTLLESYTCKNAYESRDLREL